MNLAISIFSQYGVPLYTEDDCIRGIFAGMSSHTLKKPLPAGVKRKSLYRFLTAEPLREGAELCCIGQYYRVIQSEAVYLGRSLSHYESVLQKTGGVGFADRN